jgi:hypothetical protein
MKPSRAVTIRLWPYLTLIVACAGQPALGPRRVSSDSVLVFEQRRTFAHPEATAPAWEAWQLYESGRFVYARAGADAAQIRIDRAQLRAIHAWLSQHDFELVTSRTAPAPGPIGEVTASCQIRLSTGLALASLGDPRYYACDELRKLCDAP